MVSVQIITLAEYFADTAPNKKYYHTIRRSRKTREKKIQFYFLSLNNINNINKSAYLETEE